jgi:hypothetical protein
MSICDLDSLAGEAVAALKLLCGDRLMPVPTPVMPVPAMFPPVLVKLHESAPVRVTADAGQCSSRTSKATQDTSATGHGHDHGHCHGQGHQPAHHVLVTQSFCNIGDLCATSAATGANGQLMSGDVSGSAMVVKPLVDFNTLAAMQQSNLSKSVDRLVDRCAVYTHGDGSNVHAHIAAVHLGATPGDGADLGALLCGGSR